jgi:hypothetical protein
MCVTNALFNNFFQWLRNSASANSTKSISCVNYDRVFRVSRYKQINTAAYCDKQVDLCSGLSRHLLSVISLVCILFDGFSLSVGWSHLPRLSAADRLSWNVGGRLLGLALKLLRLGSARSVLHRSPPLGRPRCRRKTIVLFWYRNRIVRVGRLDVTGRYFTRFAACSC